MTTCSHSHHHHDADSVLRHARSYCEGKGLRLTPLRETVLQLIATSEGPAKAYDLLDRLKPHHAGAAPPTIYRAIDFLLEHGFIHKIESINAYVACPHPSDTHVAQFLLCRQCGKAVELDSVDLPKQLQRLAEMQSFVVQKLVVEVHGRCQKCL